MSEFAWIIKDLIFAFWILLPAYAANMFPPMVRNGRPIDGGKTLADGNRILGDGKTVRGFAFGVFMGTLVGVLAAYLQPQINAYTLDAIGYTLPNMSLSLALLISVGAMTGDSIGSFIKRRMGMGQGADAPLMDQLNFIVGALLFSIWFTSITPGMIAIMVIFTPIIHRSASIVGYFLKIKSVPW